ncbi:TPR repeat region-containing protein [Mycolicibacterium grossiae]|uniref:TPR repeat region-containing protein n=1 Tax=Mycolicibacterium grossiae TaxID=1552759 RepID=UPI000F76EF3E|nr:EspA/EspE family type VII secretion system effector [Mycolicibacterium grossiae]QEM43950.1 hypothetical protein FZ046_03365 [Mycolicibacterium grossiae]
MGALDGFYSTWSQARQTYGEGPPASGERFDASSTLNQLKSDMDAAKPEGRWSGKASEAYGTANAQHQQVIGRIGELDQKLAAQVNNAAALVSNGRTQLDELRTWVTSAAASTTNDQAGRTVQMQIAKQGLARLTEIMTGTHGEMQTVKGNITTIQAGYDELKQDMRFAKEDKGDADPLKEDEEKPPEMHALPPEEQARRDVEDALAGDQGAAGRVEETLSSIKPGQDLSPQQDAYLSQMQSQQKGMSVDELTTAEQRLGDHKNVIADSWQLMSNDDVKFSGSDGKPGSAAMLPDSVQKALNDAGSTVPISQQFEKLKYGDDLQAISQIVQDGNPELQTGTELDRKLIVASDAVMDTQDNARPAMGMQETAQSLFQAVDDDHQIINDHLMGRNGVDVNDFLHDVNTTEWTDDGRSAGHLFSWTNEESSGPEAWIASETAEKYANYIGSHKDDLMGMNGQTLGEVNPELVRGYAHGLTPYIPDMAGLSTANTTDAFDNLDVDNPIDQPLTKGVFSVLSTDGDSFNEFHSAADAQVIAASHAWAEDVKNGIPVDNNDARMLDAQTLRGLTAVGTHEAAEALGRNASEMYEQQKAAYERSLAIISAGSSVIPGYGQFLSPGVDVFGATMQDAILGKEPTSVDYTITPLSQGESARFALNALLAADVPLQSDGTDLNANYFEQVGPDERPLIRDLSDLARDSIGPNKAEAVLTDVLQNTVTEQGDPTIAMKDKYGDTVANPNPTPPKAPGQ